MQKNNDKTDLPDSIRDKKELEPEFSIIELPDVSDIPGQENIIPAPMGDLADNTISSSDEEGDSIFSESIDDDIEEGTDSNVSAQEREDLQRTADDMPTDDDINLRKAALDNTDGEGTPLNESSFKNNITGSDLDIPGAEDDNENEIIGEEDEENNEYSLGDNE